MGAAECVARDEGVHQRATKQKLSYGELATAAAALPVPKEPMVKDPKNFRVIGMSEPRVDGPQIVVGAAKYGDRHEIAGDLYCGGGEVPDFLAGR